MIDAIKLHSMELEDIVNKGYSQLAPWNIHLEKIYIVKKMKKPGSGFQNKSNRLKVRRCELNLEAL